MRTLSKGAEALVLVDETKKLVLKRRVPKGYRIRQLDDKLRLQRMRREAKVIETLSALGVPVPKLLGVEEKTATITLQLITGKKLRNALNGGNYAGVCTSIGKAVGAMHHSNIIHGDLTTSNMLLRTEGVVLIDFGLSAFSNKDEDKAVDLHLFHQALRSSHHEIADDCFSAAIIAYKKANGGWENVLRRLKKVEERGRNKNKEK